MIRHSFAEREVGSWLPTETAQTRNRSQQLSPEKAECPLPRTESVARRTPQRSQGPEPTPSRGERCATGRLAVAVCRRCAFSDVCRWQGIDAMHSQAPGDGRICAKCVLGRLVVTRFRHGAFPGGNPWQVLRSMHPESGLGRENRQLLARSARHASGNGLALARCARHVSEKPRKSPSEDTPREDLARKGPFSLHGPFESRTARESCHRSAHERKGSGRKCLRFVKTEPKRQKMSPKVLTSF